MGNLINLAEYRTRKAPPLQRGDIVRHRAFDWAGQVRCIRDDGMAEVHVGLTTYIVQANALRRVARLVMEDGRPCDTEMQS